MRSSKKPGMNLKREDGLNLLGLLLKSIPQYLVFENAKNHTHSLETFGEGLPFHRFSIRKTGREPPFLYKTRNCEACCHSNLYNEIPVSIIKNNLKTAGVTREEYFVLLEKD